MKTVRQVISLLPQRVSNIQHIIHLFKELKYCHKDGNIYENGTPPVSKAENGAAEKARYETARELAKSNRLGTPHPRNDPNEYNLILSVMCNLYKPNKYR